MFVDRCSDRLFINFETSRALFFELSLARGAFHKKCILGSKAYQGEVSWAAKADRARLAGQLRLIRGIFQGYYAHKGRPSGQLRRIRGGFLGN